jgi:hypothetical protein
VDITSNTTGHIWTIKIGPSSIHWTSAQDAAMYRSPLKKRTHRSIPFPIPRSLPCRPPPPPSPATPSAAALYPCPSAAARSLKLVGRNKVDGEPDRPSPTNAAVPYPKQQRRFVQQQHRAHRRPALASTDARPRSVSSTMRAPAGLSISRRSACLWSPSSTTRLGRHRGRGASPSVPAQSSPCAAQTACPSRAGTASRRRTRSTPPPPRSLTRPDLFFRDGAYGVAVGCPLARARWPDAETSCGARDSDSG